jgi:hypothetical protein
MGAPEGGLKQCAKGRGQDRTSGGGACVSKARFPFVRVGRQAAGWRPFLLKSATVSAGHSSPCLAQSQPAGLRRRVAAGGGGLA